MLELPSGRQSLTKTFERFFHSEKAGGIVLIVCTSISLVVANSSAGPFYLNMWQIQIFGLTLEHWINDALMAVFFLFVGLELERELYNGELSSIRNAMLPIIAAVGGLLSPALIHLSLNAGTPTQVGIGIPMATDIAFAIGVLALLGNRVPASLKVFVVAFATMDDLGAIVIIAALYTTKLSVGYLAAAVIVWGLLFILNNLLRIMSLIPYLIGGAVLWFCMLKSGVHATLAGVLLAFAIPFSATADNEDSPSHLLENFLHKPVAFLILPAFALANTAIVINSDWMAHIASSNSIGIIAGLVLGKPIGLTLFCFAGVAMGICRIPTDLSWRYISGAGIIGGIGFTMSIFIANLAFSNNAEAINASKMAILCASISAGVGGYLWLRIASGDRSGNSHLQRSSEAKAHAKE